MPIFTAVLYPSELKIGESSAESLNAHPDPEGVYTITRTFKRDHALLLDAHLDRLEESARLENIPLQLDRALLRAAIRTLIQESAYTESRFRITIPRHAPQQIHLSLEALRPVPPEIRQQGVQALTLQAQRQNPSAKTTHWLEQRQQALAEVGKDIYEGILLDDKGFLLEGSSSNFYAVLNGELRTAEQGILKGISRQALLAVAEGYLALRQEPIHLNDLAHLSEAFLTSSSRGVLAIVGINHIPIADGTPQAHTLELAKHYDAWADEHLEKI